MLPGEDEWNSIHDGSATAGIVHTQQLLQHTPCHAECGHRGFDGGPHKPGCTKAACIASPFQEGVSCQDAVVHKGFAGQPAGNNNQRGQSTSLQGNSY
jgi:hypothetical protein